MEKCTITVKELAKYLGVHTDTIYDLVHDRNVPHIRFGKKILFSKDTIDAWMVERISASVVKNNLK